jgi:uncharacterized membrane protein/pimeloyl-ACP methyl ester carboxylesterase
LGFRATPFIASLLAIGELVTDKLPKTPSRLVPPQFAARVSMGALTGAAIGLSQGHLLVGVLSGIIGSIVGTLAGSKARAVAAQVFGRDLPATLLEDAVAIGLVVRRFADTCWNRALLHRLSHADHGAVRFIALCRLNHSHQSSQEDLKRKDHHMFTPSLFKSSTHLLLASVALALCGCTSQSSSVVQAAGPSGVKNVLLVHGAWADGSSWNNLIATLHADGFQVTAVQLPLTSLADDVAVVQRALALEVGKTLLVGHSYGGVVITEVGVDPKVAGLVYVSAYAPDAGESAISLNSTVAATPINSDLSPDSAGFLTISAAGVAADFAQDLPAADQITIAATQGPISAPNALSASVTHVAWKNVPTWYVVASNDRVISPTLEATMAKRMNATTLTLQSGHLAMISHPAEVSAFVEKAATSLQP